ncbi:uncharacterized protein CCOS01_05914 [Colletotrichum costaricense]|uniref:Uncharacterized protein n=1 Tax=Colletotrichum costaricense TaxID=1209916 RepID=A0AAI9Z2K5_9PEZI|nr:uncharacterized protein CCOS01_05914 [Colletotrichum costaricense]KAK1530811.1 hypothetical protein CCOS01_05914 [Colletotrichum costaricense]
MYLHRHISLLTDTSQRPNTRFRLTAVDICAFSRSPAQHVISAGPDRNESLGWRHVPVHHIRPPLPVTTKSRIDLQTVIPRVFLFVQNCTLRCGDSSIEIEILVD